MTASALGRKVGVSESTVVRFATELGFKGYPELQKELQQMIKSKLTAVQRMEVSESLIGDNDIVRTVLNGDIDLIRETYEKTSREDFAKAVSTINKARKYIFSASVLLRHLQVFSAFILILSLIRLSL